MKKAFLTFLSDDAILFRPGPVNGKDVWRKAKETTAQLEWRPTLACVAASGELGYTSGPWVFTPEAHLDQPPQYGYFVSVWKKERDGSWRVVLDLGTTTGIPEEDTVLVVPSVVQRPSPKAPSVKGERRMVQNAEEKFSATAHNAGLFSAYGEFVGEDGRIYREGIPPIAGRAAVLNYFSERRIRMQSSVTTCVVSKSCDFAYTYGTYSSAQDDSHESGYFVRMWRKDVASKWKLAVEILSPQKTP